jgi:hypothetical protein
MLVCIRSLSIMLRTASWLVYGARWFTASGYERSAQGFDPRDDEVKRARRAQALPHARSRLIGRLIAAIDLTSSPVQTPALDAPWLSALPSAEPPFTCAHAAAALALSSHSFCMVCRSPQRGEEALAVICQSTGNQRVHLHTCDLSDMSDIRRFAREFAGSGHRADTLINNAGGMASTVIRTREGAEQSFATNVLGAQPISRRKSSPLPPHAATGTYYMTHALLPVMQASAAQAKTPICRVITVSSGGM